jgi:hypothetical protein
MKGGGIFTGSVFAGLGEPITLETTEIVGDPEAEDKWDQIVTGFKSGAPCSSKPVIEYVQAVIGTTPDGAWGPNSAKALKAHGRSFAQIAAGCKPPVPSVAKSGGGFQPLPQSDEQTDEGEQETEAGFSEMFNKVPTVAWVGLAGIAALLLYKAQKDKQGA